MRKGERDGYQGEKGGKNIGERIEDKIHAEKEGRQNTED